ncbi:MAG: rubredoxin [Sandarakinorhabdus sp.]|nr:rubredoxin [Sandarakinorhabdus sp.]
MRWIYLACGHVYDEAIGSQEHGIPPGTALSDLTEDWDYTFCGSNRQHIVPEEGE